MSASNFYSQSGVAAWYGTTFQAQADDWYSSIATWEPGAAAPAPSQALSNAFSSFDTMAYFQQRARAEEERRVEEQRLRIQHEWVQQHITFLREMHELRSQRPDPETLMNKYPETTEY